MNVTANGGIANLRSGSQITIPVRAISLITGIAALALSTAACAGPSNDKGIRTPSGERVAIHAGTRTFVVDLYDNPTARDLVTRLPMTLKATNYPGYDEKVIRVPRPLSMEGAPRGDNPKIPEVGYYAPGQWIALYYGPIGYWPGKVPLGRIAATKAEIGAIPENTSVTIERVKG